MNHKDFFIGSLAALLFVLIGAFESILDSYGPLTQVSVLDDLDRTWKK